jgi:hypothetical protein
MSGRVWLTLVVLLLSGCRIVSQQQLAELKPDISFSLAPALAGAAAVNYDLKLKSCTPLALSGPNSVTATAGRAEKSPQSADGKRRSGLAAETGARPGTSFCCQT